MSFHQSAMRRARGAILFCVAVCAATAAQAQAQIWRVDAQSSEIRFTYTEDGAPAEGAFNRFRATGSFDPARPQSTRLALTVEVDSVELSNSFRTDFVKNDIWFDVARHPRAEFELDRLRQIEGDRYEAVGTVTIKGVSRMISTEVDLEIERGRAYARGEVNFDRIDFGVGDTVGGLFVDIGRAVGVSFDLVAIAE